MEKQYPMDILQDVRCKFFYGKHYELGSVILMRAIAYLCDPDCHKSVHGCTGSSVREYI